MKKKTLDFTFCHCPCPRALPISYECKAPHNLHYDGPLVRRMPYHGALTLNLISLGTVEHNGWVSAKAFICSHTIVYVAMKSRFPSPLWCDTSSTRVTSRSQISQSATVNLIPFLVIPCAHPVLTRGAHFWLISPVWTLHVHSVPINPCNHSTFKNLLVFTHGLKPGFFFKKNFTKFPIHYET
jgi:hypothetical protein